MCGFFQTLGDNMDYILTEFNEILYCSFWEKVEKLVKNYVEKFSKCQTWVTSQWEIFHVKIFFADFRELKDVDSKNEKKNFLGQKFFLGPKNAKKCHFWGKISQKRENILMCGFLQMLRHNVDYLLTKFDQIS